MTTALSGKNRITVPAEITRRMLLAAGTQFDWAQGDAPNQITITITPTRKQRRQRVRALRRQAKRPCVDEGAKWVKWREDEDDGRTRSNDPSVPARHLRAVRPLPARIEDPAKWVK